MMLLFVNPETGMRQITANGVARRSILSSQSAKYGSAMICKIKLHILHYSFITSETPSPQYKILSISSIVK